MAAAAEPAGEPSSSCRFLARQGQLVDLPAGAVEALRRDSVLLEELFDARETADEPIPVFGISSASLQDLADAVVFLEESDENAAAAPAGARRETLDASELISAMQAANYLAATGVLEKLCEALVRSLLRAPAAAEAFRLVGQLSNSLSSEVVRALAAEGSARSLSALGQLAAWHCSPAVDHLQQAVQGGAASHCCALIAAIMHPARGGQEWAIAALQKVSEDVTSGCRHDVASAMGFVAASGHAGVTGALGKLARDEKHHVSVAAVEALGVAALAGNNVAAEILLSLRKSLPQTSPGVLYTLASTLGPIASAGHMRAADELAEISLGSDMNVRFAAIRGIGAAAQAVGNVRATDMLRTLLTRCECHSGRQDSSPCTFASAMRATVLGIRAARIDDDTALRELRHLAFDVVADVRRVAANALGPVAAAGRTAACEALTDLCQRGNRLDRCAAAEGLIPVAYTGQDWARSLLIDLLGDDDGEVQQATENALATALRTGIGWAVDIAAQSRRPETREAALKNLVSSAVAGDKQSVRTVSSLIAHANDGIRESSSRALHNLEAALRAQLNVAYDKSSVTCLQYIEDADAPVRSVGLKALIGAARKGHPKASIALLRLTLDLAEDQRIVSRGLVAAAPHLARIASQGNAEADLALRSMASGNDIDVASAASRALSARCERSSARKTHGDTDSSKPAANANSATQVCRLRLAVPVPLKDTSLVALAKSPMKRSLVIMQVNMLRYSWEVLPGPKPPTLGDLRDAIRHQSSGTILYLNKLIFGIRKQGRLKDVDSLPLAPNRIEVRGPELVLQMLSSWLRQRVPTCDDVGNIHQQRSGYPDWRVQKSLDIDRVDDVPDVIDEPLDWVDESD
eukprot:TRINITY_DN2671_c2_g3_i1.p1 TRINITY_DN2671_c2_g3~~TRINITY_DN2671_c2_g3_i1.p1  ORF type:complete len:864 (-),score=150.77 TRINITY_DN2671_c2_g3_i1:72-2663(-)